jgi:ankyrin
MMHQLPAEVVAHIGQFLDQRDLASLVRVAKRYHLLLTADLYDSAIEYIDPSLKLIVDTDLRPLDFSLPKPWFGYKHTVVRCAKHWKSGPIQDYFSKKPLDDIMAPYMEDICSVYEIGETLLHQFAMTNNLELTTMLLERGANIETRTALKMTALHYAISKAASIPMIQLLLDFGANIMAQADRLESAMSLAASCGSTEVVKLVMEAMKAVGGEVFAPDISGYTPLHRAAMTGSTETIRILLENGADPLEKGSPGGTALHSAILSGNIDAVSLLIDATERMEGDLSAVNDRHETALHLAVGFQTPEIARLLMGYRANHLIVDNKGDTPLALALKKRAKPHIRMFLELYPDIWPPGDLHNELWKAAQELDLETLQIFFKLTNDERVPIDFNIPNHRGNTVLHLVCLSSRQSWQTVLNIIRLIIQAGGNVDVPNYHSRDTPIHCFLKTPYHGPQPGTFYEVFQTLLGASSNLDAQNHEGNTLLHCAVAGGDLRIIRMLLEKLERNKTSMKNKKGCTPLHCAIAVPGSEHIISLLVASGASIDDQTGDGLTPLHLAARAGVNILALRALLESGADLSILNNSAEPPVHLAADNAWDEAVGLLLQFGSPPHSGCPTCERRIAPWTMDGGDRQKVLELLWEEDEGDANLFCFDSQL